MRVLRFESGSEKGSAQPLELSTSTYSRLLVSDIDGTLTGDAAALEALMAALERAPGLGFGVASGRSPELVREAVERFGLLEPDLVIASVGSEMDGPGGLRAAYETEVGAGWDRAQVEAALAGLAGLTLQGPAGQRPYKVSYHLAPESLEAALAGARSRLAAQGLRARLIASHGEFLDVLPERASKGTAVRFASAALGVPLERVVVAGDSGNDAEMLRCGARSVVVANYEPELAALVSEGGVYLARKRHAAGVLEGLRHFGAL